MENKNKLNAQKFLPPLIVEQKQTKLLRNFPKYLHAQQIPLTRYFGDAKTNTILSFAKTAYPDILKETKTFNTPMYDALMIVAGKMAAIKKGMNATGISTEEFVRYSIEQTRAKVAKAPFILRKLAGRFYLSSLMRRYLKGVAKSVSANGWPTRLINGSKKDDFTMSIETRDCQMVAFWESIGEGDIRPYCTFFDFTSAESLGIGLKQVSTIDSGVCKYCFYKKGEVEWPDRVRKILN